MHVIAGIQLGAVLLAAILFISGVGNGKGPSAAAGMIIFYFCLGIVFIITSIILGSFVLFN
jgi:hypothetical protein